MPRRSPPPASTACGCWSGSSLRRRPVQWPACDSLSLRSTPFFFACFLRLHGNPHVEGGPVSPCALEADGAAVVFGNDPPHDHQAQTRAGAYRLGGKSLLQHFRLILVANS